MKQIEVTTRVKQSLNDVSKILEKQGFSKIRTSRIEDIYMTQFNKELSKNNIIETLKKSVLIRYLCVNKSETFKKLTYKNKIYKDDMVISEEKINVNIDDIKNAEKLLMALGFEKLVEVKYDVIVFKKDNIEFAFQDVENLGLLLEYENENDFSGLSEEKVIEEKNKMLEEIKKYNIMVTDEFDVKKAYELITKELGE
ncbi:MAG: hypothetical protein IJH20_00870 [Bacilli bacterium]|nr:hypothetical protein [Bacilli bacterium]